MFVELESFDSSVRMDLRMERASIPSVASFVESKNRGSPENTLKNPHSIGGLINISRLPSKTSQKRELRNNHKCCQSMERGGNFFFEGPLKTPLFRSRARIFCLAKSGLFGSTKSFFWSAPKRSAQTDVMIK